MFTWVMKIGFPPIGGDRLIRCTVTGEGGLQLENCIVTVQPASGRSTPPRSEMTAFKGWAESSVLTLNSSLSFASPRQWSAVTMWLLGLKSVALGAPVLICQEHRPGSLMDAISAALEIRCIESRIAGETRLYI